MEVQVIHYSASRPAAVYCEQYSEAAVDKNSKNNLAVCPYAYHRGCAMRIDSSPGGSHPKCIYVA